MHWIRNNKTKFIAYLCLERVIPDHDRRDYRDSETRWVELGAVELVIAGMRLRSAHVLRTSYSSCSTLDKDSSNVGSCCIADNEYAVHGPVDLFEAPADYLGNASVFDLSIKLSDPERCLKDSRCGGWLELCLCMRLITYGSELWVAE